MLFTVIYGSSWQSKRTGLWKELQNIQHSQDGIPWVAAGDFNVVRFSNEKIGGIDLSYNRLREFNECMNLCSLTDIRSTEGIWTWNNKGIGPVR